MSEVFEPGKNAPELRDVLLEATRALTALDAERLEELAASCRLLTEAGGVPARAEARRAERDRLVLRAVLVRSRRNLELLRRLSAQPEQLEYEAPAR